MIMGKPPEESIPEHPSPKSENDAPLAYFEEACKTYQEAEDSAGGRIRRFFRLAGTTIELDFAGHAMVPYLTPALDHLSAGPMSDPDLTVRIWDTGSTGRPLSPPPWTKDDYSFRGEIRGFNTERIQTAYDAANHALSMLDRQRNQAINWLHNADRPIYRDKPLMTILNWWLNSRNMQFVHGAAVGTQEGAVLIAGKSGAGKSTSAVACFLSGMQYLGDDFVLVSTADIPRVHCVYNSARLGTDQLPRFPELSRSIINLVRKSDEKAMFMLSRTHPESIGNSLPIRAVLMPEITGLPDTHLELSDSGISLRALCTSTAFGLAGAGQEVYRHMARLVARVPSYHAYVGTDLSGIGEAIAALLRRE